MSLILQITVHHLTGDGYLAGGSQSLQDWLAAELDAQNQQRKEDTDLRNRIKEEERDAREADHENKEGRLKSERSGR